MQAETQYVIDRGAVETEVARTGALLAKGKGRYMARQFVVTAVTLYVVTFVTKREMLSQLSGMPAWKLLAFFGYPAVGAALVAWWSARETFKDENLDVDRRIERISTELKSLAGPGWIGRSLRLGIKLGVTIGLTVGVILLLTLETLTSAPNRWVFFASFVGVTLLWTIPAAFLLRWVMLLALKRLVKSRAV